MKREFDAPIKYSKSRDGYYYSEPGFSLSNAPLSQDEKANLQMAGEVFELYKNNNELGSVGFSIEKMQSNLLLFRVSSIFVCGEQCGIQVNLPIPRFFHHGINYFSRLVVSVMPHHHSRPNCKSTERDLSRLHILPQQSDDQVLHFNRSMNTIVKSGMLHLAQPFP